MANFYGNDTDNGQSGGFTNYYGGDGNDFLQGDATANAVYGGQGNDVLNGSAYVTFSGSGTLASPYVLTSFGPSGNDYIEGGAGDDVIYGADGDDVLYGGDGNESGAVTGISGQVEVAGLFGGDGNDYLDGGNGNDSLDGGNGNDSIVGGYGNDTADGGAGNDAIDGGSGADSLSGGAGADVISGGFDDDILNGGDDNDFLYGNAGNDRLDGGAGSDLLSGGAGGDIITGGLGRDFLYGNGGRDLFDFNAVNESGRTTSTRDQIYDFHRGEDRIDLRTIDANTTHSGNSAFKFIGNNPFSHTAGELRIRDLGDHVIVQADVNGDAKSDMEILVRNVGTLSKSDFFL